MARVACVGLWVAAMIETGLAIHAYQEQWVPGLVIRVPLAIVHWAGALFGLHLLRTIDRRRGRQTPP